MSNDDKCPCVDGLPDPCTLCGAPADGVCEIDTLVGWKHRAQRAEAEARQLREAIETAESVGVDYCTLHHGIRNEDEHSCDFRDDDQEEGPDGEPRGCVLVELIPRPTLAAADRGVTDGEATDG